MSDYELTRKPVDAHAPRMQGILFVGLDDKPVVKQAKSLPGQRNLFGEDQDERNDRATEGQGND